MNKKIFAATVALGSLVFVGGTQANAEATTQTHMETDTGISFYTGSKPNPGPFAGQLSLAYVPGNFDFGSNEVATPGAFAKVYSQSNASKEKYIAVSDDRKTKKKNWKLTAKLAAFTYGASDATAKDLDKAVLSFNTADLQAYAMNPEQSDAAKTPTPGIYEANMLTALSADKAGAFTQLKTVSLEADAAEQDVLSYTATQQQSEDALIVATAVTNVQLKVLDHSKVANKTYTSKISWDLADDVQQ